MNADHTVSSLAFLFLESITRYTHSFILTPCINNMRFFCLAALLASACAFTQQPAAFTTQSPVVGERAFDNVVAAPSSSHRNRRATIVMDGKANGEFILLILQF